MRAGNEISGISRVDGRQCPFIHDFLAGCHCTDMRSTRVEEAIYYCGANYRKCDIYKMIKTGGSDIPFQLSRPVHGENI